MIRLLYLPRCALWTEVRALVLLGHRFQAAKNYCQQLAWQHRTTDKITECSSVLWTQKWSIDNEDNLSIYNFESTFWPVLNFVQNRREMIIRDILFYSTSSGPNRCITNIANTKSFACPEGLSAKRFGSVIEVSDYIEGKKLYFVKLIVVVRWPSQLLFSGEFRRY